MASPPTILVFDSGLGGLTVLREIVRARPDANYVYVADDVFFPYGHHGEDEIIARVLPLMGEMIAAHAPDLVVIACNTMSVSVMAPLRAAYSVPFVGTVPAIKPACAASTTKRVSVLGTRATVKREYTQALIRDHAQRCTVTLVGSPDLASLAEAELNGAEISDHDIRAEIAPCFVDDGGIRTDAVVLACTHFPLLLERMTALAPWPVAWIDPAPAIARRVVDLLGPVAGGAPQNGGALPNIIYTSGKAPSPLLLSVSAPFFGVRSAA
ncbi:glutamate racemase [soil metagenome]